jgi:hypothetical protein
MTTSISFRPTFGFYIRGILRILTFAGISTVLFKVYLNSLHKSGREANDIPALFISVVLFILALYSIFWLYKNAIRLTVNSSFIAFNKKTFYWSKLTQIELTGKQPYVYVFTSPREGIKLQFGEEQTKYIFDHYYTNVWQLKLFLQQVVINKQRFLEYDDQPVNTSDLEAEFFIGYKGHPLFTWHSFGFLLWLVFFSRTFLAGNLSFSNPVFIIMAFSCFFWYSTSISQMYYFDLSRNYLVIKNHLLPWKKKVYRVSSIKEIVLEKKAKMPCSLRVITNDFKTSLYHASTPSKKSWRKFKTELESYHIKVRDECQ